MPVPRCPVAVVAFSGLLVAQQHWAFVAPVRPPVPAVRAVDWPRNAVDRFVLARLESEGLAPSAAATRAELLRRVTFDLTGLPPTPADLAAFLADPAPDAYERVVDRLLASPAAAEESTRLWLDLARYADTHGMQRDQVRALWRWRDWVLDAYAAGLPFDRFVTEQLAGDLLADATPAQRIASGFNRCNPTSDEGGLIPEEYLARYAMDRTDTFGKALLGLTVGCAQCHDHKYDPLTQRDYYRLFAYFSSFAEAGNDGGGLAPEPAVSAPRPDEAAELARRQAVVDRCRAALAAGAEGFAADRVAWERTQRAAVAARWQPLAIAGAATGSGADHGFANLDDGSLRATGAVPVRDTYTLCCRGDFGGLRTLRLVALPDDALPERGPGRAGNGNFVLTEVELMVAGERGVVRAPWARCEALYEQEGHPARLAIDGDAATGWAVQGRHEPTPLWLELAAPLPAGTTRIDVLLHHDSVHAEHLLGRFALAWTTAALDDLPADLRAALEGVVPGDATTADQLGERFLEARVPGRRAARAELATAERALADYAAALPRCMVSGDLPTPRPVHVLTRGRYDQPGEAVTPGTPAFLPPLPAGALADRRALAAWLFAPDQPLTARVAVNHVWLRHFGRGLVATPHDFGTRGAWPSHPELLDWLACEFRDSGWDERRLHRLLVTSATYRQSARCTADALARDPDNVLLARASRCRLPAEAIRDQALAVAGLLVCDVGGPSVRIPQPPGIWEPVAFPGSNTEHYVADTGDAVHRRSLYTFWKRTAPPPLLVTLDAPSREQCVVERQVTNTPLQVLALWNDEGLREAAAAFAQRVLASAVADEERLDVAFGTLLQRAPTAVERAACRELLAAQRAGGDEVAAWTLLTSTLFGLDEALHRN